MDYVKRRNIYNKDFDFYNQLDVPITEILKNLWTNSGNGHWDQTTII